MYLHSLRLKNFKGFRGESDEICFHGPNAKPGSGLNILVGENNAGKSTILQAISFLREYSSQKKDPTSIAPNAASNETISDTDNVETAQDGCAVIGEFAENSSADMLATIKAFINPKNQAAVKEVQLSNSHVRCLRFWPDGKNGKQLSFLKEGEGFDAIGKNPTGLDLFLKSTLDIHMFWVDDNAKQETSYGTNTPCQKLLEDIVRKAGETKEFEDLQKAFDGVFSNPCSALRNDIAEVEKSISAQFQAFFGTGNLHFAFPKPTVDQFVKALTLFIDLDYSLALTEHGHGVQRIAALAVLTAWASVQARSNDKDVQKPYIFLLDEPEICLHPRGQENLLKALLEISRNYQVFVTTHSPIFLHSPNIKNANLLLCRREKGSTVVQSQTEFASTFKFSPTWGEISWFAYNMPTIEFHNELYSHLQDHCGETKIVAVDKLIKQSLIEMQKQPVPYTWTRPNQNGEKKEETDHTLSYCVRNAIHHPDNPFIEEGFVENHLEESIKEMLDVVKHLHSKEAPSA